MNVIILCSKVILFDLHRFSLGKLLRGVYVDQTILLHCLTSNKMKYYNFLLLFNYFCLNVRLWKGNNFNIFIVKPYLYIVIYGL